MEADTSAPVTWRKSSKSAAGNCVEVAVTESAVRVRDSKAPGEGSLAFSSATWASFIRAVKAQDCESQ
jgi:Domain of unknown function (DUF397)